MEDEERQSEWDLLVDFVREAHGTGRHQPTPLTDSRLSELAVLTPHLSDSERRRVLSTLWKEVDVSPAPASGPLITFFRTNPKWFATTFCSGRLPDEHSIDFEDWAQALLDWRQQEPVTTFLSSSRVSLNKRTRLAVDAAGQKQKHDFEVISLVGLNCTKSALLEMLQYSALRPVSAHEWSGRVLDGFAANELDNGAPNGRAQFLVSRGGSSGKALQDLYLGKGHLFPKGEVQPSMSVQRGPYLYALERASDAEVEQYYLVISWLRRCGLEQHDILNLMEGILADGTKLPVAEIIPDYSTTARRSVTNVFSRIGGRIGRLCVGLSSVLAEADAKSQQDTLVQFDFSKYFMANSGVDVPLALRTGLCFTLRFRRIIQTTDREEAALASVVIRHQYGRDLGKRVGIHVDHCASRVALEMFMLPATRVFLRHHLSEEYHPMLEQIDLEIDTDSPSWPILIHFNAGAQITAIMARWVALQLAFLVANRCTEPGHAPHLFFDPVAACLPEYSPQPSSDSSGLLRVTFRDDGAKRLHASLTKRPQYVFSDQDMDDIVLREVLRSLQREQLRQGRSLLVALATWDRTARIMGRTKPFISSFALPADDRIGQFAPGLRQRHAHFGPRRPPAFPALFQESTELYRALIPSNDVHQVPSNRSARDVFNLEAVHHILRSTTLFTAPAALVMFNIPKAFFPEIPVTTEQFAPVCLQCDHPFQYGFCDPNANRGLRHCVNCYVQLLQIALAQFQGDCLKQLMTLESVPVLAQSELGDAALQTLWSQLECGDDPGMLACRQHLLALPDNVITSVTPLVPVSFSGAVQPAAPRRRIDTDLFNRAQLAQYMAQGGPCDRVTYLNSLLRSAWLALWSSSEPHRKQWSTEAVDRTCGLLVRDPGPFAEHPRPPQKRGPSSSPAPSSAAGGSAGRAAGPSHGRPGAGGEGAGGRSVMGLDSHTTGLMKNARQGGGLRSQDITTPRPQTRAKAVDAGVRTAEKSSSSDLRAEVWQQHHGAKRVSRDTTTGSLRTGKKVEHVGTRELGLDQDFRQMTGQQMLVYHTVIEVAPGVESAASEPPGPDACEPGGGDATTLRQQATTGPQTRAPAGAIVCNRLLQHGAARLSQAATVGGLGSARSAEHVGKQHDLEIGQETTIQEGTLVEAAAKWEVTERPDCWGGIAGAVQVQMASDRDFGLLLLQAVTRRLLRQPLIRTLRVSSTIIQAHLRRAISFQEEEKLYNNILPSWRNPFRALQLPHVRAGPLAATSALSRFQVLAAQYHRARLWLDFFWPHLEWYETWDASGRWSFLSRWAFSNEEPPGFTSDLFFFACMRPGVITRPTVRTLVGNLTGRRGIRLSQRTHQDLVDDLLSRALHVGSEDANEGSEMLDGGTGKYYLPFGAFIAFVSAHPRFLGRLSRPPSYRMHPMIRTVREIESEDYQYDLAAFNLSLAMALHPRLGALSSLASIGEDILLGVILPKIWVLFSREGALDLADEAIISCTFFKAADRLEDHEWLVSLTHDELKLLLPVLTYWEAENQHFRMWLHEGRPARGLRRLPASVWAPMLVDWQIEDGMSGDWSASRNQLAGIDLLGLLRLWQRLPQEFGRLKCDAWYRANLPTDFFRQSDGLGYHQHCLSDQELRDLLVSCRIGGGRHSLEDVGRWGASLRSLASRVSDDDGGRLANDPQSEAAIEVNMETSGTGFEHGARIYTSLTFETVLDMAKRQPIGNGEISTSRTGVLAKLSSFGAPGGSLETAARQKDPPVPDPPSATESSPRSQRQHTSPMSQVGLRGGIRGRAPMGRPSFGRGREDRAYRPSTPGPSRHYRTASSQLSSSRPQTTQRNERASLPSATAVPPGFPRRPPTSSEVGGNK